MPLAMARPIQHPASGIFWLRKRVPDELRALVGKREVKLSLGTRDPSEAKRIHAEALARLEAQWANLKQGPRTLSHREAHALAAPVCGWFIEQHAAKPDESTFWDATVGDALWVDTPMPNRATPEKAKAFLTAFDDSLATRLRMRAWCLEQADRCLHMAGMQVDDASRVLLGRAVSTAMQRAADTLKRYARGEYPSFGAIATPVPFSTATPTTNVTLSSNKSVSFTQLVDGWMRERQPANKTRYAFPRVMSQLAEFVGHDDANRLTPEDLIRWKESLLARNLRGTTIRNGKLGPVRTILQWGVDNRRLSVNSASRINVSTKSKQSDRKRSFTEAEARLVLGAALKESDPVRRWVTWLCAYSGARVAEICQLRTEDITQRDGVWCMHISPEAGPLKTASSERFVPLHPAILAVDFLQFVKSIETGPIFRRLPPDRFGSRGGNGAKVLGRWVRGLGLDDPHLQPNHAWRHRFKTLARQYGVAEDAAAVITGHAPRTVGDAYGEHPLPALEREIRKLPSLAVS